MARLPARVGAGLVATLGMGMSGAVAASEPPSPAANSTPPAGLDTRITHQLAATPGGTRLGSNAVSYRGGDVVMVFPENENGPVRPLAPQQPRHVLSAAEYTPHAGTAGDRPKPPYGTPESCPQGEVTRWFCFYEHRDWNGRMLMFKDCGHQRLTTWNFNDKTSSWANGTGQWVYVYDHADSTGLLWSEMWGSASAFVGSADNDKASAFYKPC